jgi:lipopolysaccharide transport system permease protein
MLRYLNPQVEPVGCTLKLSCRIENRSESTWTAAQGFAVGWQIYDPLTSVFLSEGDWKPLAADVAPGRSADTTLDVELPAEPGAYRVFVAPVLGDDGWAHQHGAKLLVIDAAVDQTGARVLRTRVTTTAALRRERWPAAIKRLLKEPFTCVAGNRGLIESMVRRDIHARYRGSVGDLFWTVLNPALLMVTYLFVFGLVLKARFANDPSRTGFALYFLAGMMPWLPFSEAVGRAPNIVWEYRNFVKKLLFPIETLAVSHVIAGIVTQAIALTLFVGALILLRGYVPFTVAWLPVLIVPQVLFTLGMCWLLAGLGAYVRDLGQVIGFVLTLWFFLTPICYPEQQLPKEAFWILSNNPIYILVRGFRAIFLESRAPDFGSLLVLWGQAAVMFLMGYAAFAKLRKGFADVV